jgi:hypothetical protein
MVRRLGRLFNAFVLASLALFGLVFASKLFLSFFGLVCGLPLAANACVAC